MSRSSAWIGCQIVANPKKDEWFVQIVGPGSPLGRKVLGSAYGNGREGAVENAMRAAGVTDVVGTADFTFAPVVDLVRLPAPNTPADLVTIMKQCEQEIAALTDTVSFVPREQGIEAATVRLASAVGRLTFGLQGLTMTDSERAIHYNALAHKSRSAEAYHKRVAEMARQERCKRGNKV